ncbi:hypothetical protein QOT17_002981 [Balamuthia mandrillaris]
MRTAFAKQSSAAFVAGRGFLLPTVRSSLQFRSFATAPTAGATSSNPLEALRRKQLEKKAEAKDFEAAIEFVKGWGDDSKVDSLLKEQISATSGEGKLYFGFSQKLPAGLSKDSGKLLEHFRTQLKAGLNPAPEVWTTLAKRFESLGDKSRSAELQQLKTDYQKGLVRDPLAKETPQRPPLPSSDVHYF